MGKLVEPKVFVVGYSGIDMDGMASYLEYTGQKDFLESIQQARGLGLSDGDIMSSYYAKICYKTLVPGKNDNVKKVRDIAGNVKATFQQGHGSVFEHFNINFMVTDCSRVYTHEQVRHRAGWAYSQTSGRYCRGDELVMVTDPILEPVQRLLNDHTTVTETGYKLWCNRMGLNGFQKLYEAMMLMRYPTDYAAISNEDAVTEAKRLGMVPNKDGVLEMPFDKTKKVTSALRRYLPNGQANEMGMSCNIRALRHVLTLRTGRAAEWEIRLIFNQVYEIVKKKWPGMVADAKEFMIDGLIEVAGMKNQPYEMDAGNPEALRFYTTEELQATISQRELAS